VHCADSPRRTAVRYRTLRAPFRDIAFGTFRGSARRGYPLAVQFNAPTLRSAGPASRRAVRARGAAALGEVLLDRGVITPEQLQIAIDHQRTIDRRIGHVLIYEMARMTPALRELILARAPEHALLKGALQHNMSTLREQCLARVREGVTTLEEVVRVTQ